MRAEEMLKIQSDEIIRLKEEIDFLKDEGLKILNHNLKLEVTVKELTTEVVRVTKLKNEMHSDLHTLLDNPFKK